MKSKKRRRKKVLKKLIKLYLQLRDNSPRCMDDDIWVGQCASWDLLAQMSEILDKYEAEK